MRKPRATQSLHRRRAKVGITRQHARNKRHSMDTRLAFQRTQRDRLVLAEELLVSIFREAIPVPVTEGMHLGHDLVEDDPEGPHVDLGVIAKGQLPFFVQVATHLRSDVRQGADLGTWAVAFVHPFCVMEVSESDLNWQGGCNQDVLTLC